VRLDLSYDGSGYRGFARNEGVRTVAGELEDRLGALCGVPIRLTGAGRTDAGVHAVAQVVTFDAPEDRIDLDRWVRSLNKQAAGRMAVRAATIVDDDFDARFSATWRRYRYFVRNRPTPDPFRAQLAWWVPEPLDTAAMSSAAGAFVGQHDFAAFCRRAHRADGAPLSLIRRVHDAGWTEEGEELRFEIGARAFCHQMVRSIVGTLVDVGRGRIDPEDVPGIIAAGDRARAGQLAPPLGLYLWAVGYS
jgi:tRNA pseudouridine38-40 synthase